jgi:hypothetical protein
MKRINFFLAKISILRNNKNDYDIFSFDELPNYNLPEDNYDHCRFIEKGGVLTLENKKYKIIDVSFRINPIRDSLGQDFDVYAADTGMSNCVALVTVEEFSD